jgi:pimeloyl-ACP methyl ester carboxylesterase
MRSPSSVVSRTVDLNGSVHFVDFRGPAGAPVLVCVHGLGGAHVTWLAVGRCLAQDYQVLALDLPGHGLTPLAGRSSTIRANQRLLDRFLRQVVGEPVTLVGSSMGGLLTLFQAKANPSTVASAVLVGPTLPLLGRTRPDWLVSEQFLLYALTFMGKRYLAWDGPESTSEALVRRLLALCCVDPNRVPAEVVDAYIGLVQSRKEEPVDERAFLQAGLSLFTMVNRRAHVWALVSGSTVPTLLLHGDADRLVPLASARAAVAANPHWRLQVATDTGHAPMLERPDWTTAVIRDWLAREGTASRRGSPVFHRPPVGVGRQRVSSRPPYWIV